MAKGKDSVIIYESFLEATEDLEAVAIAEIWRAIRAFIKGDEPTFTDMSAKLAWKFIKLQLEADADKWARVCEKRAEAGRRGGQSKCKQTEANQANDDFASNGEANAGKSKQTQANEADTDTESDTDTELKKKNSKKEKEQKRLEAAERIWRVYPKKDGKQEGLRAILKRLAEGLSEEYLTSRVKAYCVQCEGKDKAYIKNAQGWFNNARYEDSSLDNPTPPVESGELGLREFRIAYRKYHERDFQTDYCEKMPHHRAVLSAEYGELRTRFVSDYNFIKEQYSQPNSELRRYVRARLAK